MSLSALEEKLKPEVLATFEEIEALYKRLHKMQHKRLEGLSAGDEVNTRSERSYEKLREELVAKVEQVRLHNNRIEELVVQLKQVSQRLNGLEGQLLRMAESAKVGRDDFLQHYRGHELDPNWFDRVANLPGKHWKGFATKHAEGVLEVRGKIGAVAQDAGLPISEFRRVYATVSRGERDSAERTRLMEILGADPSARTQPPHIRSQLGALEKEQKTRATRFGRDVVDRALVDLLSVHRDALVLHFGAQVGLVNQDSIDVVRQLANGQSPEENQVSRTSSS